MDPGTFLKSVGSRDIKDNSKLIMIIIIIIMIINKFIQGNMTILLFACSTIYNLHEIIVSKIHVCFVKQDCKITTTNKHTIRIVESI